MVSQALKEYKKLISEMPLSEHSSTSKKKIWKKKNKKNCKGIVKLLFAKKEESITISRKEVFDYAEDAANENDAMKEFIYYTLVWGYPTGNRGHVNTMVGNKNIKQLVKHLKSILRDNQIKNLQNKYQEIEDIKGLGLSTYTKFLYFLEVSIDKHRALILDNKLIEVFNRRLFQDFDELEKISRDNAMKKYYTIYLERMHKVGKELELGTRGGGKLERFLHVFGSNIKIQS
jgi:hypothetical protein